MKTAVKNYFVITVDTEPDDQWAPPGVDGKLPPFAFANTRGLAPLAEFFHELNVPVTWMASYSVAKDGPSAELLRKAAAEGDEIAGHLHGWETPPYIGVDRTHRPFMYEYEPGLRLAKHHALLDAHLEAFGTKPYSYRAGRWGVDELEYQHLASLGYGIDSSIPPGIDFRDRGGLSQLGPDFRPHLSGLPLRPYRLGQLWQLPVSIIPLGLLGSGPMAAAVARTTGDRAPASSKLAHSNILAALEINRLVWLRPLRHPRRELLRAARALARRGDRIVNIMFHSSEAYPGTSPISRTPEQVETLYGDLQAIIGVLQEHGLIPMTLRDAVAACTAEDTD